MTTSAETVRNAPLSGAELRDLLRVDFERLLDGEGLLAHYLAYGRISYDLTLRLHLDNPWTPESTITRTAQLQPGTAVEGAPPLPTPSDQAVVGASNIHRTVTSPNAERVRAGLPVPVVVRQADGTTTTEKVQYPPQPELGPGDVTVTDQTKAAREQWNIPMSSGSFPRSRQNE